MYRPFYTLTVCALVVGLFATPVYAAGDDPVASGTATAESAQTESLAASESPQMDTAPSEGAQDGSSRTEPTVPNGMAETPTGTPYITPMNEAADPQIITDGRFKAFQNGDGDYMLGGLADGVSLDSLLDGNILCLPAKINGHTIKSVISNAFSGVDGSAVATLAIPGNYIRLNERSLAGFASITRVQFDGTQAQWRALLGEGYEDPNWLGAGNEFLRCVPAECTDGTLENHHNWQLNDEGIEVCSQCGATNVEPITDGLFMAAYLDGQWTLTGMADGHTLNEAVTQDEAKVLVLPDEIDGHAITAIGDNAFSDAATYDEVVLCKSIDFPDGLTRIGREAFMTPQTPRHTIVNLVIPDTVEEIGSMAFAYNWITTAVLPENSTYNALSSGLFTGCYFLTDVTIPATITEIENYAFNYCSALETVHYQGSLAQWNAVNVYYGGSDVHHYLLTSGKENGVNLPGCVDIACIDGTVEGSHEWEVLEVVDQATCVDNGFERIYCDKCKMETTRTVLATGEHTYGDPVVTKAPTVDAEGEQTLTCTVCGHVEVQTIPRLAAPVTTPPAQTGPDTSDNAPTTSPAPVTQTVTGTSGNTPADHEDSAPTPAPTASPTPANTIPQTGDTFPLTLTVALLLGSGLGIALLLRRKI